MVQEEFVVEGDGAALGDPVAFKRCLEPKSIE